MLHIEMFMVVIQSVRQVRRQIACTIIVIVDV